MKDGLNVLVEDGGEIVKISANSVISDVIPVPATAEVGQTIVVKSVDENGKPTEWEAVNMIANNSSGIPTVIFVWGEDGTLTCDTSYAEIKQMIIDYSPFKAELYGGEKGWGRGVFALTLRILCLPIPILVILNVLCFRISHIRRHTAEEYLMVITVIHSATILMAQSSLTLPKSPNPPNFTFC